MKSFEVEIRRLQFITVTVDAESIGDAINKSTDPEEANWYDWDGCENATYEATYINEIPKPETE